MAGKPKGRKRGSAIPEPVVPAAASARQPAPVSPPEHTDGEATPAGRLATASPRRATLISTFRATVLVGLIVAWAVGTVTLFFHGQALRIENDVLRGTGSEQAAKITALGDEIDRLRTGRFLPRQLPSNVDQYSKHRVSLSEKFGFLHETPSAEIKFESSALDLSSSPATVVIFVTALTKGEPVSGFADRALRVRLTLETGYGFSLSLGGTKVCLLVQEASLSEKAVSIGVGSWPVVPGAGSFLVSTIHPQETCEKVPLPVDIDALRPSTQ